METGRSAHLSRVRRAPLLWAAFAVIAQVIFATVLVPRLPESFLIWFNADRASLGDMYYRFDTEGFVVLGWVATAVFVVAAVLCYFFAGSGAGWSLLTAVGVCAVVPLLVGLLYASVIWQLGLSAPADEIPSGIGAIVLAVGVIGLFAGLASLFVRGRGPAPRVG
jgi:hypothetical protein